MKNTKFKKLLTLSAVALTTVGLGAPLASATMSDTQVQAAVDNVSQVTPEHGRVGTVTYKPGYGINLWSVQNGKLTFTGRRLPHGSRWKITGTITINNIKYYVLGTNQYMQAQYVSVNGSVANNAGNVNTQSDITVPFKSESGRVGKVNYKPGYGINLWSVQNGKLTFTGRRLPHGSRWKIVGTIQIKGRLFYALGANQYMDAQYINVENPNNPVAQPGNTAQSQKQYFLNGINNFRRAKGLQPLHLDTNLNNAANAASQAFFSKVYNGELSLPGLWQVPSVAPYLVGSYTYRTAMAMRFSGTVDMPTFVSYTPNVETITNSTFSKVGIGVYDKDGANFVVVIADK